ncbi:AI-2E family transporter [Desulfofustis limnaeus]|nr:AI-2E family transporter [Desulfofustis limnaeus]
MPEDSPRHHYPADGPSPMQVRYFLLVLLVSLFFLGRVLIPFWSILVLSFLLSSFFRPVYLFCNRRLSSSLSSIITCLLITAIVFVPLILFIGALSNEALSVYQWGRDSRFWLKLQTFIQESELIGQAQEYLRDFGIDFDATQISNTLADVVKVAGLMLYNQASAWAANIMQFLFLFIMMILIIFFLLIDLPRLVEFMIRMSPLPDDEDRLLVKKFEEIATAVLKGNGICGLIQGVIGGIVFYLLGISSPILWGFIMGVLAFLPILGIGAVMIPASLILALNDRLPAGIFLFCFYLSLSLPVEYLLKPKLVGSQAQMHTLLVFLSIIGGLSVYGVLGIIYGPLILTAFLTLSDIYLKKYEYYVQHF